MQARTTRPTTLGLTWLLLAALSASCAAEVGDVAAVDDGEAAATSSVGGADQALATAPTPCAACSLPTSGLYARFRVGTETFGQQITTAAAIQDAVAVWRGQSNKHIPVGQLACSCTGWNCQWRFRIRPETLVMAAAAIEVCDAIPSYVNGNCPTFGNGYYCPWSAEMIELRDCRTNRACPAVPR